MTTLWSRSVLFISKLSHREVGHFAESHSCLPWKPTHLVASLYSLLRWLSQMPWERVTSFQTSDVTPDPCALRRQISLVSVNRSHLFSETLVFVTFIAFVTSLWLLKTLFLMFLTSPLLNIKNPFQRWETFWKLNLTHRSSCFQIFLSLKGSFCLSVKERIPYK